MLLVCSCLAEDDEMAWNEDTPSSSSNEQMMQKNATANVKFDFIIVDDNVARQSYYALPTSYRQRPQAQGHKLLKNEEEEREENTSTWRIIIFRIFSFLQGERAWPTSLKLNHLTLYRPCSTASVSRDR